MSQVIIKIYFRSGVRPIEIRANGSADEIVSSLRAAVRTGSTTVDISSTAGTTLVIFMADIAYVSVEAGNDA